MKRLKPVLRSMWRWFRRRSYLVRAFIVVPVLCAILLTLIVGNMGLAAMGGATAISAPIAGWFSGVAAVLLGKAGIIVVKDHRKPKPVIDKP